MERLEAAMAKARAARGSRNPGASDVAGVAGSRRLSAPPGVAPTGAPTGAPADFAILPALEIPESLARRKRLNALLGPEVSTPYDMLRSRVVRQMKEAGWKRLAVTSPTTRCGKSTISLNLALSLARYGQFRIVLMDFDLRRPTLAGMLELSGAPDIGGLLRPGGRLADHAYRFGSNLAICPNRAAVRHSAELLQSSATGEALDRIEAEWQPDFMIFDTPPMRGNDDNLGFLPQVDCALVVAAAGSTSLPQVDRVEEEVSQLTNVLGVVLNKCRYTDHNTGFDQSTYY